MSGVPTETGLSYREVVGRLVAPVRLTALLLFGAPLLELAVVSAPPLWLDPVWRVVVAGRIPGALTAPVAGTLVLAVLAVARPTTAARVTALLAAAVGLALAGLSFGVLAAEGLPMGSIPAGFRAAALWPPLYAVLTGVVFGVTGWGVYRHGTRSVTGAALPEPRVLGIDLLE